MAINAAEGNFRNFTEALEGEDLIPEYHTLYAAANLPNWLRLLVRKLIDKRRGHLLGNGRKSDKVVDARLAAPSADCVSRYVQALGDCQCGNFGSAPRNLST